MMTSLLLSFSFANVQCVMGMFSLWTASCSSPDSLVVGVAKYFVLSGAICSCLFFFVPFVLAEGTTLCIFALPQQPDEVFEIASLAW